MNNTIEFVLRMRDMMSSNITRVGSASQSAFNRMSQSADNMTGRNRVLGSSFTELQNKIRQVEDVISRSTIPSQIAAARRELAALQRQSANHAGNINGASGSGSTGIGVGGVAIGSMLGGLATGGATMILGAVRSGVGEMVSQSMAKEQAITGLTTFLGKQGATEAYKNIRSDANATPYDTASLLEVNRSLISAGANAKDARTDTMNLANAVSAVGGGNDILSRMAANMQQIKTVGKATAMDIRQFGIAGINIYEMLARSTGKNINQVKEMDVTYEDLAKSLAMANSKGGIYEGAMTAQSKTKSGKWSTVKDNFSTAASDIGDAFSPLFNKLLDMAIKFANGIGPMIAKAQPYINAFSNSIGKVVDYITAMVNGTSEWSGWTNKIVELFNYLSPVIFKIVKYVGSMLGDLLVFIKNSEILKDILSFVVRVAKVAIDVVSWAADKIMWLWKNVVMPILNGIERVYKWIKGGDEIKIMATKKIVNANKPKGDNPVNSPLGAGGALMASNNASSKSTGDTVSGAGPKVVNIHVGKFFDNLQFTTMNAGESANEIEKIVMECFARVVYNGSKMV
jgi:tape measure domain-containing protein